MWPCSPAHRRAHRPVRGYRPQLKHRTHTLSDAAYGARRFIIGLSKKVLLANVLYELISAYKSAANVSVLFVWLYAAAYILHLYFDFSGYSDMAIGLGRIFGFHFIENFNYPYISASVTEFWRRWHMSLGSWFRDYVYIPLGGNRVSKAKWFRNIFIVWLLTGLWHGAAWTFILWGIVLRCVPDGGKALVRSGAGPDTVFEASLCSAADCSQLRYL